MAFDYRLPGGKDLIVLNVRRRRLFLVVKVRSPSLHPLLQAKRLVLQRMGKFMGEHGLLLLGIDPVQQVHRFRVRIVITRYLFAQQSQQKIL